MTAAAASEKRITPTSWEERPGGRELALEFVMSGL
jgi:hypothetical protein